MTPSHINTIREGFIKFKTSIISFYVSIIVDVIRSTLKNDNVKIGSVF